MNKARIEAAKELVKKIRKKKHKSALALLQDEEPGESPQKPEAKVKK